MARLSGNTLLQRAIPLAAQDRESLSDAYARNQPEHGQFREQARTFEQLKGVKLAKMTDAQRQVAFQVLVCAEQWEESLADANHRKGEVADECLRNVRLFREFRHAEFGRTRMEVVQAEATTVDIRDLVARHTPDGQGPSKA